jgi:hypothetical protein
VLSPIPTSWNITPTPISPKAPPPRILTTDFITYGTTPTKTSPSKHEQPTPIGLVIQAAVAADSTPFEECQANLIQIVLLFCMRSCEYTNTVSHRHTVQFRFKDIQFHNEHGIIPQYTPDHIFLFTKAFTLFLDTQKNSVQGESSTIESTGVLHGDLVLANAHMHLHLRANHAPPDIPICSYYHTPSSLAKSIRSHQITSILRSHTAKTRFQQLGFYPHEIRTHSLISGGAMTLHLAGVSNSIINIIGRWRLDAFLIYLQGQIATFAQGVSTTMPLVP